MISLPLALRPNNGKLAVACACSFLAGISFLLVAVHLLLDDLQSFHSAAETTFISIVFLLAGYIGLLFFLGFLFNLADLKKKGYALVISDQGVTDFRSGVHLEWSSVKSAKLAFNKGVTGIYLYSHGEVIAPRNPIRADPFTFGVVRRPDRIFVPVRLLDRRPHIVAQTMLVLTRRSGGQVSGPLPTI